MGNTSPSYIAMIHNTVDTTARQNPHRPKTSATQTHLPLPPLRRSVTFHPRLCRPGYDALRSLNSPSFKLVLPLDASDGVLSVPLLARRRFDNDELNRSDEYELNSADEASAASPSVAPSESFNAGDGDRTIRRGRGATIRPPPAPSESPATPVAMWQYP